MSYGLEEAFRDRTYSDRSLPPGNHSNWKSL